MVDQNCSCLDFGMRLELVVLCLQNLQTLHYLSILASIESSSSSIIVQHLNGPFEECEMESE